MSEKYRIVLKDSEPNLISEGLEIDTDYNNSLDIEIGGYFYLSKSSNEENYIIVDITGSASFDDLEIGEEPDGEPTYVPYGDQSVLYDDGRGYVEYVKLGDALDLQLESLMDEDENVITVEEACKILGCSEETLNNYINNLNKQELYKEVVKKVENYLNDTRYSYLEKATDYLRELRDPMNRDYEED